MIARLALIICVAASMAASAHAATYYVDGAHPSAADANTGAEDSPWKTLGKAAATELKPGDVVVVKPGRYDQRVTIKASGEADKLITFRAEPARKASVAGFVLTGDYIQIEGFEITTDAANAAGINAGEAHRQTARKGCRIINNFIHDVDGRAILTGEQALVKDNLLRNVGNGIFVNSGTLVENNEIDGLMVKLTEKDGVVSPRRAKYSFFAGEDITFRGNYFHGTPMEHMDNMGVCFFGSWDAWLYGPSKRILIENNRCFNATHASEPDGRSKKQSSHITYRNNLFVNTSYVGIFPQYYKHVTIENNTLINCGAYPIWFASPDQVEGSAVRNNLIAYHNHKPVGNGKPAESGIRVNNVEWKLDCDYNMFLGTKNRGYGKNDFEALPQFVDPDKHDYRLKPGSPGIDAGQTLESVPTDQRGVKRPQGKGFDIGAYETEQP